jgi:general secretion pathway protein G
VARITFRSDERGFTLVELLIIIIVLGILAAIVLLGIGTTKKTAVFAACNAAVKSVELSAEVYNSRIHHYPDTQSDVHGPEALLKSWPASDEYSIVYVPIGYSAGPPAIHASDFSVTVVDTDGATVATCNDL